MVMGRGLLIVLLGCFVFSHGDATFEFMYREGNATTSTEMDIASATLNGSHINLGDWPHWCLGNLSRCHDGLTLDTWVRFTKVSEDSSEIIVFTSGGHTWYSNGVYFVQRFGDEYEVGVALEDQLWRLAFRVRHSVWVNVFLTWDIYTGLTLMLDGARHEVPDPETRTYRPMTFDAFNDVTVGLNADGTPLTGEVRFDISILRIYNWIETAPAEPIDGPRLWIGCGALSSPDTVTSVPRETAIRDCRAVCSAMTKAIAAIRNSTECACTGYDVMESMDSGTGECNVATDFNFFSASGLEDNDAIYSLSVSVEILGTKSYVKPFESVLVHISSNFVVDVPYTVDFGDGNVMDVDGQTVSYFWTTEGHYQISVFSYIGIATISGNTDFSVENVDEGTAGDYVMLNAIHGIDSKQAEVDFTNIDYATGVCGIKYGDSNQTDMQLTDLHDYVENAYLTHTYSNVGRYKMHVDCLNPYGTISNETYFTSKKLGTTFHYHDGATPFNISVRGDSGFFEGTSLVHHDVNMTAPSLHKRDNTLAIDSAAFRIYENYLTYFFEGEAIDKRIINVQNEIGRPGIFSSVMNGSWNLTTNITVRVPPGNNMFLNVSFSAGEDQLFFIHYLPYQSDIMFEIVFPALGYYPVQANVSNDISSNTAEMLVSVEVPLQTISLNITPVVDKSNPVVLLIDLNEGMQGPMKVNFEIDQGNGYTDIYSDYSNKYFYPTYRQEYTYPDWGTYDVCVRAFNRISSVIDCVTVQVGEKITYVDILTPSMGRFETNETMTVIVRAPKGSDKTFIVDFGDGETFVFTDAYLKETEDFPETTTSTVITSTSTTPATTTLASSGSNVTSDTNNSTAGTMNGTATTSSNAVFTATTTESTATTTDPTSGTPPVRRRREANATDASETNANMEMGETTTESTSTSVYSGVDNGTINSNATDTTSGALNGTNDANETTTPTPTTTTSTTTPIPTTTTPLPSTMEPIPDDASNPYTSTLSSAHRRRGGTVAVTHRYQGVGTYTVKVQVANHFNWAQDELCPKIIVAEREINSTCNPPELTISTKLESSKRNPLQFYRSEQINLMVTAAMTGCRNAPVTYSWRTDRLVEENGKIIRRPYHGEDICVLETTQKIYRYPRSSLPFGRYIVTLVVSPSGHPLQASSQEFFMDVNPSPPHAVIQGEEHLWFLFYGTTMIRFPKSIDPDFDTHDGIEYDLVCMTEPDIPGAKALGHDEVIRASNLVTQGVTWKYTSKNPVRLYEYRPCFDPDATGNLTRDIRFPKGQFYVPSEYFLAEVNSFALFLYVTKNDFTTMAHRTFEIRMSNETDLLAQLDNLLASKDTTGVMRAVTALSAGLVTTSSNSSEEEAFEAKEQMTELKSKLIGALDSVSEGVADIDQAGGMIGLVDDLTKDSSSVSDTARAGATSAIKNSAEVTEGFADEPLDSLTDVGTKVVSGVSNVLPKEDETAKMLAEHEKNLQQAELDAKAAMGPTDEERENGEAEEGADITLEEGEAQLTELTEEDLLSNAPLPYNKLLKKCDLLHGGPLDKLYKYLFFYESIFRHVIKNKSEEIMVSAEILKLPRNDIFCYIGVLEEPGDVEWYYNRFFDEEKRRRDLIKKNADRDVSKSFLGAIDSMSSVLLNKTEANQTVEFSATGLKVAMKRASANATDGEAESMGGGGAGIKMPASALAANGNDSEVGQTLIINDENPFTFANENDTTSVGTGVVTFKLSTPGVKDEVSVSNTTEPIEIYLAANPKNVQDPMLNTLVLKQGQASSTMNYHSINVTKNDTTLHLIVRPQFPESGDLFDVLIQYEDYPNDTHHLALQTLPLAEDHFSYANLTWEQDDVLRHTFFPDAELTKLAGIYKVGVRLRSGNVDLTQEETMFNYTWQMFMGGCRFWNHENETWDSDGCIVGSLTTYNATQCLCTHLTSFGGEMVVPPNTIDFNNVWAKFKDLNENAAVFSTVVSLLGVYVIGLIWARHMDKKDIIKWGATPLEDNLPTDNYHYQLSVYTGMKKNSGTKSNISFIMSGEVADTGVRRMFDGKRKSHEKSSIMNYILSVEESLGSLSFCRIWHDNSGEGKDRSWYLDQIEVSDLQTGERYYFLCNRWLACEEDDGMVDRILPVASIEDLVAFKQLFSSSVRKKLSNDHLWLSVFSRPTRSSFTRVQRISCCMSLLFLTMITNAMWFKGGGEEDKNKQEIAMSIGPFSFTLSQIFISLASTIIVFPPSFALITLFRRTKQKKNTVMQTNLRQPKRGKWKNLGTTSRSNMWGEEPKESKFKKFKESISELVKGNGNKTKYGADELEEEDRPAPTIAGDPNSKKQAQKKKKKPYMFPHWCNYIAWILCFFSVITPAFFTILYSMEWGKEKANEWLTTFVLSFFQSVIVVQPIKVLCLVAFIACVLKKPDLDEEVDPTQELNQAIATHEANVNAKGAEAVDEIARRRRQANEELEPPDTEALEEARKQRIKEMKMEAILKEIAIYFFFVLILFFLSYQQRDVKSFFYTENMKNIFLGKYEKVSTVLDYWNWLEGVFMPALYVAKFHNGTEMTKWWDKRCLSDFQSRRMGIARMRQFRIKEDSCNIQSVMRSSINHCRNDYNWYDDDTMAYLPYWKETSAENRTILDKSRTDPFVYQNSYRLKSAPYLATLQTYKGGGYVVNFERSYRRTARNLTRLREQNWLDLRTRAVFLEFTVYNPNSNLFASAVMVSEFPATGGAVHRTEFKIFRLQSYVGGFAIVVIFFEVLYCCFTIFFFVRCVKKVRKEKCKYFKTFWDIMEFTMLCFGVACIAMYVFKHMLTEVAFHYLKKQSQPEFINFQSLAMYDELYGYMTAIVVFLATIQFLKLLQFNKKMNMLGETVKLATKDLKVFSVAFMLYFGCFAFTAYLLFGKQLSGYLGLVQSAESTFAFTLGAFDFDAMTGAQKIIGPIFFFAFIMVIYVGMMSIFLTIIAEAFTKVKEETEGKENEYEMVDFIWKKFKGIIGVK